MINSLFETVEFWFVTKFRTLQILLSSIHNYAKPQENFLKVGKNKATSITVTEKKTIIRLKGFTSCKVNKLRHPLRYYSTLVKSGPFV